MCDNQGRCHGYIPGIRRVHMFLHDRLSWYRYWHHSSIRTGTHLLVVALTLLIGGAVIFGTLNSENPKAATGIFAQFPFQGRLTNADGTVVANSSYDVVFQLYTTNVGCCAVWSESHTGGDQITTTDGIFNTMLGSLNSLSGFDFNQDEYWLGITVGADAEMTPRIRLGAAPYAFNSDTLDGVSGENFLQLQGQVGGQTAFGGTNPGDQLVLRSTSHSIKGYIVLADEGGSVVVGNPSPQSPVAKFNISTDDAAQVGLIVRAIDDTQTGDLQEWDRINSLNEVIPVARLGVGGTLVLSDHASDTNDVQTGPSTFDVARLNIKQNLVGGANIFLQGSQNIGGSATTSNIYFGDGKRAAASISSTPVNPSTTLSGDIAFSTTSDITTTALTKRWSIESDGTFLPGTDNTYSIGSTTDRVKDIYLGPSSLHLVATNAETGGQGDRNFRLWVGNPADPGDGTDGNLVLSNSGVDIAGFSTAGKFGAGTTDPHGMISTFNGTGFSNLNDLETDVNKASFLVNTDYAANTYVPGITWTDDTLNPVGNIVLHRDSTGTSMLFGTSNDLGTITSWGLELDPNNNVVLGDGALATSATNGFLYIDSVPGTPTGTPTSYTNRVALTYDNVNDILYGYNNGAWQQLSGGAGVSNGISLNEVSAPSAVANQGKLYVKSVGGSNSVFYKDENGIETDLVNDKVGAAESLRTIRGSVNANGTIAQGSGFSITHSGGSGVYQINFSTAFSSTPTVTASPHFDTGDSRLIIPSWYSSSTTSTFIRTDKWQGFPTEYSLGDYAFDFIIQGNP